MTNIFDVITSNALIDGKTALQKNFCILQMESNLSEQQISLKTGIRSI